MILQLQLAFFQAPQLELVVTRIMHQKFDDRVQIAMLDFQFDNAPLQVFRRDHVFLNQTLTGGILKVKMAIVYVMRARPTDGFRRDIVLQE
jgi:hypothetical protein